MALRPTIICLVYTIYDWPELQKHYTSKDTNIFYSDGKTDLKLRCICVWYSGYLRVPKMFIVDWWLCVTCYYPKHPYRLPRHYKRQVCGPSCSYKHWYFWVLLSSGFHWYSKPLTTFLVKKEFLFHRPVLIFQPTVNPRASDNPSMQRYTRIRSAGKNAQLLRDCVYIRVCEGV